MVPDESHSYIDGASFKKGADRKYRVALFDSAVFFLQNSKAAELWPVTSETLESLLRSFESNDSLIASDTSGSFTREKYVPKKFRKSY